MKTANCELDPDCVPSNAAYYSQGYSGVLNFTKIATFPYYASKPHFLDADDYYGSSLSGLDPQVCSCANTEACSCLNARTFTLIHSCTSLIYLTCFTQDDIHQTYLDVEPYSGYVLRGAKRLQLVTKIKDWTMPSVPFYNFYGWDEDKVRTLKWLNRMRTKT